MGSPTIFNGRRTKTLTADGMLLQSGAALDNDGSRNYISNGHAESVTTPWATYADAAGTRPVDGTGGSPNITWTRSTSSPLRGQAEFVFTKDAANRQGQGVSYDFTIDRADLAKPLDIKFDLELLSGTFVGSVVPATDSDVIVYLYDVTNAALIEPAGRLIEPMVTGNTYRYRGTFQTASNSQSYRLILHIATTSASAYTLGFDNFYVGPQVISNGAVITDAVDFTPTSTIITTSVTMTGRYWRVGQHFAAEYNLTFSGTNTQGGVEMRLPTGITVDSSKHKAARIACGEWVIRDDNTATNYGGTVMYSTVTGYLYLVRDGGTLVDTSANNPITFANNDRIQFTVDPVLVVSGWSSNVQMSNDTDTRVVSFVGSSASSQAVTANTTNTIATTVSDSHGAWTGSTYIVPVSGDYVVSGAVISNASAQAQFVYRNGSVFANGGFSSAAAGGVSSGAILVTGCKAGDVLSIRSTTSVTLNQVNIAVYRLSGPSQIAASEFVGISANTATTSISSTTPATVIFTSEDYDTHGCYNNSTGEFTAPIDGYYLIQCFLNSDSGTSTTVAATGTYALLYIDGASTGRLFMNYRFAVTGLGIAINGGTSLVQKLRAGQVVTVRMAKDAALSTYSLDGGANVLTISKLNQ
jgi:hypothetical protein